MQPRDVVRECLTCGAEIKSGGKTGKCLSCSRLGTGAPPTVRHLSDVEVAWLAAMIDTDGYITLRSNNARRRPFVVIGVANTDVEIISTALRLAGAGTVVGGMTPLGTKMLWQWRLWGRKDTASLLQQLRSMSIKIQTRPDLDPYYS